jgi:hypothetical protein
MNDYRLVFESEQAWQLAAQDQGWMQYEYEPRTDPDADPVIKSQYISAPGIDFDVIGIMYAMVSDPDQVPEQLPGWHVNIRFSQAALPSDLADHVVVPENPQRTFAGGWFEGVLDMPS